MPTSHSTQTWLAQPATSRCPPIYADCRRWRLPHTSIAGISKWGSYDWHRPTISLGARAARMPARGLRPRATRPLLICIGGSGARAAVPWRGCRPQSRRKAQRSGGTWSLLFRRPKPEESRRAVGARPADVDKRPVRGDVCDWRTRRTARPAVVTPPRCVARRAELARDAIGVSVERVGRGGADGASLAVVRSGQGSTSLPSAPWPA